MENYLQKTPMQQKAYAIAFVLNFRQVLAQEATTDSTQKSQVEDILDRIMISVKEPHADHLNIYMGMFFAMAFLGYFLYTLFGGREKFHSNQLLASDLVDSSADSVNKDSAYHKMLDQQGPYAREPTGILTKDSTIKLRKAITEKAYLEFKERRDELLNERVALMKQNRQQDYMKSVGKSLTEYRDVMQRVTQSAINFLDISEEDYVNSFKVLLQAPENQKLVMKMEEDIRDKYESQVPLNKSAAEYKKIFCEKLQMEAQAEVQMQQASLGKNPQQVQQIALTIKQQVLDKIYAEYGLKVSDLMRAVNHFNLDKDPDVESIRKANSQIKNQFMEKQQKVMQDMQKEMQSVFDEEFKVRYEAAVKELGKLAVTPNGFFSFEDFVKIQHLIAKFVHELTMKRMAEHKELRRQFLQQQQEPKYQECVSKFVTTQKQMHQQLMQVFVAVSQVDVNVFNNSGQFYSKQEKFIKSMNEFSMKQAVEYEDANGKILDTDVCIKAVRRIEEAKIGSIDMVTKNVQAGRIPQQAVPIILEVDKCRVLDKLFLEEKIDNEDIGKTVRGSKLMENEEFKKMIQECQAKFAAAQASWAQGRAPGPAE